MKRGHLWALVGIASFSSPRGRPRPQEGVLHRLLRLSVVLAGLAAGLAGAGRGITAEVSFSREIAPLLKDRCLACHRAEKSKGDYRLDTFARLSRPGSSGKPPWVAGVPSKSPLAGLLRAGDPDDRMPQDADPLSEGEIALMERWIREGARFDGKSPEEEWVGAVPEPVREAPEKYPGPWPITALAWAPGGESLAVSGFREVRIHAVAGGGIRRLGSMPERVQGLSWSPDGRWLAVAGGRPGRRGEVQLLTVDGTERRALAVASDLFLAVAFSPDGTRLAAGGTDNALSIFDVKSGRREQFLPHHADWVLALAWSPDSSRIATASRDRTARVCDARTGIGETAFTEHAAAVMGIAFGTDGKWVWSAGRDRKLRAWDAVGSEIRRTHEGWSEEALAVVLGGGRVWGMSAMSVRGFPIEGGKPWVLTPPSGEFSAMALDSSGRRFATGTEGGQVTVWRLDDPPVAEQTWRVE